MREYLGVPHHHLDELIDAAWTWKAAEEGSRQLKITHVRALLRRVPGARETYMQVAQMYPALLTADGEPAYPEGYAHIGEYLAFCRRYHSERIKDFFEPARDFLGFETYTKAEVAQSAGISSYYYDEIEKAETARLEMSQKSCSPQYLRLTESSKTKLPNAMSIWGGRLLDTRTHPSPDHSGSTASTSARSITCPRRRPRRYLPSEPTR